MSFPLDSLPAQLASKITLCPIKGCWLWTGSTSGTGRGGGYGRVTWRCATWAVHKLVWLLSGGRQLRPREQLDHGCRVRRCCNPAHLKPMFQKRNMLLAHSRKRAAFVAEAVR
ncbi:MAG: hypothetical protein DI549_20580 [Ancylobacter novellus]|uniref:HNH nuclease domain-containing protein n=1 Tax=Ancylobacter novellus TaxID=921 RepID=A0A2W5SI97_ANCNO|nr:MAG: hypothetical protein DI549_20580 [Ancylobacter novellus]